MLSYAPIHICKWSKVRLPFPSKLKHSWRFWIVSLGLTVFVVFDLLILSKISRLISFLDNHTSIACLSIHIIVVVFRYIKISSKKHQYLWPDIFSSVVVAGAGGCAALTRWRRTISEKTTKKVASLFFAYWWWCWPSGRSFIEKEGFLLNCQLSVFIHFRLVHLMQTNCFVIVRILSDRRLICLTLSCS